MKQHYNCRQKPFLFSFLFSLSIIANAQPGSIFTNVANTGGLSTSGVENTALAVSKADNKMFLAYIDIANSNKLTVLQYNGISWSALGTAGISVGAVNYSIGIATINTVNGNEVYVAYSDAANGNRLTILRWAGTGWATDGTAGSHSSGDAGSIRITAANNGELFVAYNDLGTGTKAFVKKRVSGSWTNISGTGISAGIADDIGIACDNVNNQPYIVYKDATVNGKATVRKYNGTTWNTVGTTGFTSSTVSDCSIAVDRLNRPNISYNDGSVNNRATVRYYDGSSWQVLGFSGISSNIATYTGLVFDYDNNAYIIYKDNAASGKATVKKYNGTSWGTVATSGFSSGTADYTNIEFDSDQNIYIAYKDAGVSNRAIVQQLSCVSPTTPSINSIPAGFSICAGEGIQLTSSSSQNGTTYSWYQKLTGFEEVGNLAELNGNSNNSGAAFSATVDANGNVYVAKMQTADSMIVVKRFAGGVWQTIGGALGKSAGFTNRDATDIAFDADGNLYVAYIDFAGAKPIVVKKFVSNNWVDVGPAITEGCLSAALHINSYGMMALATGKKNGFAYYPTVFVNTGTGWIETPEVSSTERIGNLDVTIDRLGNVIVGFINPPFNLPLYDAGIPKAYKYNGISWTSLPLGLTESSYFITADCDRDNNYYVSTNSTGPSTAPSSYKVNVMRSLNQGTSWTNIGPADVPDLNGGNTLAIDKYGTPYLGFVSIVGGISKYKLVKYVSSAWVNLFATLENANSSQIDLFFDKSKNVPLLMEFHATSSIKKGNVYKIEKKFISTGTTRYTTMPGDYFLMADAGCTTPVTSPTVTVTQTSATNNWTGAVSTEFNAAGNWSCGRIPITNDDVLIPASAARYPVLSAAQSANVSIKSLTIATGGSVTLNGQILNIAGDLIINGTLNASTANSKVVMNGTEPQIINGILLNFYHLTINNPMNVTISNGLTLQGDLIFVNGKIILGSNGINVQGNITGTNTNRYIITPSSCATCKVGLNIAVGEAKIFPIGTNDSSYTPMVVSHNSTTTTAFVQTKVGDGVTTINGSNANTYVNKYWSLSGTLNISYNTTVQWNSNNENSSFNRTSCGIYTTNSNNITVIQDATLAANATTVSATAFSRSINNVPAPPASGGAQAIEKVFRVTSTASLLPIQLLNLSAKLINSKSAKLEWEVAQSSTPKSFTIERSNDGISFDNVGFVAGSSVTNYAFTDNSITKTGHQYYRLLMTDLDGKATYSPVAKVYVNGGSLTLLNVFPQPSKTTNVSVSIDAPTATTMNITITDIAGRQVLTKQARLEKGISNISLDISSLQNGIYFIKGNVARNDTNCLQLLVQ